MTSIYDDAKPVARKEVLRLTGIEFSVATDEQIAKGRLTHPDFSPQAQMVVRLEPLSYELTGGQYGNSRTEYLSITGFGKGLTDEEIEMVRAHGWRGAGQTGKRFSIPNTLKECREPWQLFMFHAKQAGLRINITADGQAESPDIGVPFEFEAGFVNLPTRVETAPGSGKYRMSDPAKGEKAWSPYMRLPLQRLPDYVIPEDRPTIVIASREDETEAAPAATTTSGSAGSNVTAEQLAAAASEAGIIGANVSEFEGMAKQVSVTNKYVGKAPVLASGEVQAAASEGALLTYLQAKGAITVDETGNILAAV